MAAYQNETRDFARAHLVLFAIVLVGFARTFYLHDLFFTKPLPPRVTTHGVVLTLWFVVVALQGLAIQGGRRSWHRALAWLAVPVLLGVVATGLQVTTSLAMTLTSPREPENNFVWMNYVTMPVFLALVAAAVAWRRRATVHRRLILFASFMLASAAIARVALWPALGLGVAGAPALGFAGLLLLVGAAIVYDRRTLGRVHAATWMGFAGIMAPWVIGAALGMSGAGYALMQRLGGAP